MRNLRRGGESRGHARSVRVGKTSSKGVRKKSAHPADKEGDVEPLDSKEAA